MYNKTILIGRLTRDPEVRVTSSGISVARFTIAIDRITRKKDEEIFVHRSCKPLGEVQFNKAEDDKQLDMFSHLCDEGMCGV